MLCSSGRFPQREQPLPDLPALVEHIAHGADRIPDFCGAVSTGAGGLPCYDVSHFPYVERTGCLKIQSQFFATARI